MISKLNRVKCEKIKEIVVGTKEFVESHSNYLEKSTQILTELSMQEATVDGFLSALAIKK